MDWLVLGDRIVADWLFVSIVGGQQAAELGSEGEDGTASKQNRQIFTNVSESAAGGTTVILNYKQWGVISSLTLVKTATHFVVQRWWTEACMIPYVRIHA